MNSLTTQISLTLIVVCCFVASPSLLKVGAIESQDPQLRGLVDVFQTGASATSDGSGVRTAIREEPRSSSSVAGGYQNVYGVLTNNHDNARTGAYPDVMLNPLTVNGDPSSTFGKLHRWEVDAQIYGQPLYIHGLILPDGLPHNVVYATTEKNGVYAFDTETFARVWNRSLGPPVAWNAGGADRKNLYPWVGITSTPVIDLISETIYLVTHHNWQPYFYTYELHALDLKSGAEKFGGPVEIQATISCLHSNYDCRGNKMIFNQRQSLNRPGLLLSKGTLYIGFGGQSDQDFYHGWVMSYDSKTLRQLAVFNTTPTGGRGSIWQAGRGIAADQAGNLFFMTGNGEVDFAEHDLGMSFVRLDPSLNLLDWYTPDNHACLNQYCADLDLGSSGPLLILPRPESSLPSRVIGGGKEGYFYLFDTRSLTRPLDRKVVTALPEWMGSPCKSCAKSGGTDTHHIHSGPVLWDRDNDGTNLLLYLLGENDFLKAFIIKDGKQIVTPPVATSFYHLPPGMPGGTLSVSSSPTDPMSGIVWATVPLKDDAGERIVEGRLLAFQAAPSGNKLKVLWDSQSNPSRDGVGLFAKFCPPTIVDGKVFVASFGDPNYRDPNPDRERGCTGDKDDCTRPGYLNMYGLGKPR